MDNFNPQYWPLQKLPYREKDTNWRHQCIDAGISTCYTYGRSRRQTPRNKRRNYNLFNNKIDKTDFDYALNPFNLSKEKLKEFNFPASLQPYDIGSPPFHLLLGEESKRLFNPIVIAINDESTSEKQELKKQEILAALEGILQAQINPEGNSQQEQQEVPELLKKYSNYTPKMMRESVSQKLFEYYRRKERIDQKFNDCFKDYLIAGEEIIDVCKVGDGVSVRRVNPLELWYQLRNNSDILDDAEKIYERNQMTVSEIIDEFYEYLTPDQIDELETWGQGSGSPYNFGDQMLIIPEVTSIYAFEDSWTQGGLPVHRLRWNSKKKVGIHHFLDENNQEQEEPVDETFLINKEDPTQYVEWFWINEYWEGVRIGQDMYIEPLIRPRKQQFRSIDNLSENKSGYFGNVCSATNSVSTSLMDRLVPWIYLYLIIWYRTELAMAKNIGNLGLIDISLIPDNMEPEKWIYYAQAMGFGFVDSYSESNRTRGGNISNQSTQNKSLDLDQIRYIKGHMDILRFIEEKIENTSGITRQRMGEISSSELVGNTERAVIQSSHITEPYFAPHDYFKLRVSEAIIEVAKECLEGKTKNFQYITDDLSTVLFTVQGDDFINADYGVFMSNSTKDLKKLETYRGLLQAALQNDKVQLSQIANALDSDNFADIKANLLRAEQEQQELIQRATQGEQQHQQELQKQKIDFEREKMEFESQENQLDREKDIQIGELRALGADAMGTKTLDTKSITDQAKLALEQSKLEHQKMLDLRDQSHKESVEKLKLKQVEEQNKSQEKMQEKQIKLKEKEIESKEKIARMKPKAPKK